jgi:hypothetical protein
MNERLLFHSGKVRPLLAGALIVWLAGGAAPPVRPVAERVASEVKRVYSLPEFLPDDRPDPLRFVLDWVRSFFRWLGTLYDKQPLLYWALLTGLLALLGLLLVHITWTLKRALFVGAGPGETGEKTQRLRLSSTFREEALRRAAANDFTEAIRHLFLSLVYLYDESGRVSFQRAYTNREYLELFADRPEVYADLKVFVDALDQHWYGVRPANQERYAECLALYEALT